MAVRWIAVVGALLAATGVALGAFGAHGLERQLVQLGREANLAQRLGWFDAAVRYQLYHGLACLIVSLFAGQAPLRGANAVGALMLAGVALFCGSLYGMTFLPDAWRRLGAVTPLGGLAFILGWAMLAVALWRRA